MQALQGYFNGKEVVALQKIIAKPNQKVIITILDEYMDTSENSEKPFLKHFGKLDNESSREMEEALKDCERVDINEW